MKKILSHWSIAFVTLLALTYIGFQDPWVKEILRLKSFDYVLQNEVKTPSEAISIVTIDEQAIEKHGQWPWKRDVLAQLILDLRNCAKYPTTSSIPWFLISEESLRETLILA